MYLSVAEVAKRFKVNHKYVYDLVSANVLPSVRFQKPNSERPVIRIPIAGLEQWEAQQLQRAKYCLAVWQARDSRVVQLLDTPELYHSLEPKT